MKTKKLVKHLSLGIRFYERDIWESYPRRVFYLELDTWEVNSTRLSVPAFKYYMHVVYKIDIYKYSLNMIEFEKTGGAEGRED